VDNLLITQILPAELLLSNKNNAGQYIQPFIPALFQYVQKSLNFLP